MRRYSGRRDAQGKVNSLAEDIRMSSLEALLPDDLEKHVQPCETEFVEFLERQEVKTYCECGGHAARNTKQKGSSHPGVCWRRTRQLTSSPWRSSTGDLTT